MNPTPPGSGATQRLPRLGSLIFHVTASCNLRCRHCWQRAAPAAESEARSWPRAAVTEDEFESLVAKLAPLELRSVKFTGGEPLLCGRLPSYLEITRRRGLTVSLETNATLVDNETAKMLARFAPAVIAVGVDGPDADAHDAFRGSSGAFRKALRGVENLVRQGLAVQIISSIVRPATETMREMGRLASELGVAALKFNPIQPVGRGEELSRGGTSPSIEELLQANDYARRAPQRIFKGRLFMSLPLAFQPFPAIHRGRFSVCQVLSIMGLLPNGDLSLCGVGCIDDRAVLGNFREDDVERLWRRSPLLQALRSRLPGELGGVCGRCLLRSICLGECRATAFHQTGDWTAPFWICQQAMDCGLFPASRLERGRGN